MILADKIINLRKRNGWSQEELAKELGVSRQAISKWESCQAVPDMARILELSGIFGVSTDFLMKDQIGWEEIEEGPTAPATSTYVEESARRVTLEEANAYLDTKEETSRGIAAGVALCILSPIVMILLAGAMEEGVLGWSENLVGAFGSAILIMIVACSVVIFVRCAVKMRRFEGIEKNPIETAYGVDGVVQQRRDRTDPLLTRLFTLGIGMLIASPVPVLFAVAINEENEFYGVIGVSALLAMVAGGVWALVRAGILKGAFQVLLEEGDYTRVAKERSKVMGPIAGIYWCVTTAIYLGYSFITEDWDHSWIVWPVAGVLFGALAAYVNFKEVRDESRR